MKKNELFGSSCKIFVISALHNKINVSQNSNFIMKISNLFVSLLLVLTTFTSCSKDDEEEYEPTYASAISNSLFIEIADKDGNIADYDKLLKENKLFAISQVSKKNTKFKVTEYQNTKVVSLTVDTPDMKHMTFNNDKTSGYGKTDLAMEINDKQFTITVNFEYSSANKPDLIGGSSIYIKDIEYNGKKITPTDYLSIYSIRIKLTDDKPIIEPL